jgi:adenylylsulfate kinase-like enzyme
MMAGRRARRSPRTAASKTAPHARTNQRFVILTGLSGSGKSHAIRALEDLGLLLRR